MGQAIHRAFILSLAVIVLQLAGAPAYGSHIVGGSLTYEYVGQVNSLHAYKVRLKIYRDCSSNISLDNVLQLGIYRNYGNLPLLRTKTLSLEYLKPVDPPSGGNSCSFQPLVCLEEGLYEDTILLPSSSDGYYLTYHRCCRNQPTNLQKDMGQTFLALIPNTALQNSSPGFTGIPLPISASMT